MKTTQTLFLALTALGLAEAAGQGGSGNGGSSGSSGSNADVLLAQNIQAASDSTGGAVTEAGQANSATDPANFINFCTGKTLTNGTQLAGGSCNGVVMGDIPSSSNMISSIITFPGPGDTIAANQNFTIQVQVLNLVAGSFTNPDTTYYSAPQALEGGNVVGHTHVTVQDLGGNIATTTPPDPATFAFFKGINDDGNGQGGLSALVAGGLPAGVYRVCTMTSSSNHQPVLMPIAQRGAQDDCQKFTVTAGGGATSGSGSGNTGNNASGSGSGNTGNSNVNAGGAASSSSIAATTTTSAAVSTTAGTSTNSSTGATTGGKSNGGRGGGRGGRGRGRGRFAARDFIA